MPLRPAVDRRQACDPIRTQAGRKLPPYYLVYFFLVELLQFPHRGRWEKTAWSIPVEFNGWWALIEHRKMGLGVFSAATLEDEVIARQIVAAIHKGVTVPTRFFDHLALDAINPSDLNVNNNSEWLLDRYHWLRDEFLKKRAEVDNGAWKMHSHSNLYDR